MTFQRKWHTSVEYRVVWCNKGSKYEHRVIRQRRSSVLAMLRWHATDKPWLGVATKTIKRAWFLVAARMGWPFENVEALKTQQIVQALRDTRPRVDWIRIEQRQVGNWVEMIDPLQGLKGPRTAKADAKRLALLDEIDAMTPEQLEAYRWKPKPRDDKS